MDQKGPIRCVMACPSFTLPSNISELDTDELDLSEWRFVGPPLPRAMEYLSPLASKLRCACPLTSCLKPVIDARAISHRAGR